MWGKIKCTNISIIGTIEGEERKKLKNEEIMAENSKMLKNNNALHI